jgi:carotenoid cleavage dioxygenase-like enzyme
VMIVDRQTGRESFEHECWIVDAGNVGGGAVAKIAIPHRLRPQIHGWWVSAAALAAAKD